MLKGKGFWLIPIPSSYSQNFRKLLQLRTLTYRFVEWNDKVEVWKIQGSKYLAASVWEEIRPRKVRKEWHKLVWTSLSIQKHVVITWMAVLDRLPTLVCMASWGIEVNSLCKLCQNEDETRYHIFFQCSYPNDV